MRIVFLGDSLTWGQYGGDFVAEVAKRLPEHETLNAGVGGDTVVLSCVSCPHFPVHPTEQTMVLS